MTDDKVAFSYDENGNISGTLNISEIQRYQREVAKTVVLSIGAEDYMSQILALGRGRDEIEKYMALVGAVSDLADIVDSMLDLLEALGVESRTKLQEIYTD
ncbi:hypothetical protein [Brachybacterium massiliense]|uniref:hypothetical protein n=1 Tax=Brachybacterium massiliense TaxID=1755098 RepID=UPI000B3BC768|nr:hypothetical protein [Brachybacterium massiliense]